MSYVLNFAKVSALVLLPTGALADNWAGMTDVGSITHRQCTLDVTAGTIEGVRPGIKIMERSNDSDCCRINFYNSAVTQDLANEAAVLAQNVLGNPGQQISVWSIKQRHGCHSGGGDGDDRPGGNISSGGGQLGGGEVSGPTTGLN